MKKEYIKEAAWNKIFDFLKGLKNIYTGTMESCKRFIEGVCWMARTGAQWRELPLCYGKWNSIYKRFNKWSCKNIWNLLLQFCIDTPDLEYVMIDSTIVRAHAWGNPLKFIITPGQASDFLQAKKLLSSINKSFVLGDKGYDSNEIRATINLQNCAPVIPARKNRLTPIQYDKHIYKERHLIECFFSKLKFFRRVFSRFDKTIRNFQSFLSFVGAILWLR